MHRTCKNTSVKPDRKWLVTRGEKQWERIHSTSLLEATFPSKPNRGLPIIRLAGSGLGRLPLTVKWKWNSAGTCSWSDCVSSPNISSFVGHGLMNGAVAPCLKSFEIMQTKTRKVSPNVEVPLFEITWNMHTKTRKESSKVEVLHLFRCFTHMPRCREAILCDKARGVELLLYVPWGWMFQWNQNAGKEMQMNLPECSVRIRKASAGTNRRSPTGLPFLSSGHVGPETAM